MATHPKVQLLYKFLKENNIPFRIRSRETVSGNRRRWVEIPLDRVQEPDKETHGKV